jgi:hypothetical protein
MLVYFHYLDKNPGWVQMAMAMMITLRTTRVGVNQSTRSCGDGDALEIALVLSISVSNF